MNKIGKILEKLIKDSKQSREWRSFVFCGDAAPVFFYGRTYERDHADTDESSGKCKKVMLNPMDRQKD